MIVRGDARMLPLRDSCVDCVVTSPPYWGLRDYGHGDQIGREPTPDAYVRSIVAVFADVRRVLKDSGTCWLNLGDSYANDTKWGGSSSGKHVAALHGESGIGRGKRDTGLKSKDLVGIPWRMAFALQADGWWLRSDIIWAKPNPMPESVTDRPTTAHEHLFLLAKGEHYHYDAAAIAERSEYAGDQASVCRGTKRRATAMNRQPTGNEKPGSNWIQPETRNKRTVWTLNTQPYSGAHFATMPEALVEPCILAGCPLDGLVCDPFLGSGTVGAVAERFGRRWVGVDLSYQALATARTAQRGLRFCEVAG